MVQLSLLPTRAVRLVACEIHVGKLGSDKRAIDFVPCSMMQILLISAGPTCMAISIELSESYLLCCLSFELRGE